MGLSIKFILNKKLDQIVDKYTNYLLPIQICD